MERQFPGSYSLSAEQVDLLWQGAIISFDASVLLNIYHYRPGTREQLLNGMQKAAEQGQLWLSYQALSEFHSHRLRVIGEQDQLFQRIFDIFGHVEGALRNIKKNDEHHPYFDLDGLEKIAQKAKADAHKLINEAKRKRIDPASDPLLQRLTEIVGDRFGQEPDSGVLEDRVGEARRRFKRRVPPGYEDFDESGDSGFGDYLIWCELLDHAKATNRAVIFVTEDGKGDWWAKLGNQATGGEKVLGPRPELATEVQRVAGVQFHLSRPDGFFDYAQRELELPKNDEIIEEVREVSRTADEQASFRERAIPIRSTAWRAVAETALDLSTIKGALGQVSDFASLGRATDLGSFGLAGALGSFGQEIDLGFAGAAASFGQENDLGLYGLASDLGFGSALSEATKLAGGFTTMGSAEGISRIYDAFGEMASARLVEEFVGQYKNVSSMSILGGVFAESQLDRFLATSFHPTFGDYSFGTEVMDIDEDTDAEGDDKVTTDAKFPTE